MYVHSYSKYIVTLGTSRTQPQPGKIIGINEFGRNPVNYINTTRMNAYQARNHRVNSQGKGGLDQLTDCRPLAPFGVSKFGAIADVFPEIFIARTTRHRTRTTDTVHRMVLRPGRTSPAIAIAAAIVFLLAACVLASSGDRLPAFIQCKSEWYLSLHPNRQLLQSLLSER
jgi:hypothetical protein